MTWTTEVTRLFWCKMIVSTWILLFQAPTTLSRSSLATTCSKCTLPQPWSITTLTSASCSLTPRAHSYWQMCQRWIIKMNYQPQRFQKLYFSVQCPSIPCKYCLLSQDEFKSVILLIEESILATDLAIYFKNRASTFSLLSRWAVIGWDRSRDLNTGLSLVNCWLWLFTLIG